MTYIYPSHCDIGVFTSNRLSLHCTESTPDIWRGIYTHYSETGVIICPVLAAVIREGLVNLNG